MFPQPLAIDIFQDICIKGRNSSIMTKLIHFRKLVSKVKIHIKCDFCKSELHLEVASNVIQIGFLKMHLSLDALATHVGFQSLFWVTRSVTHTAISRVAWETTQWKTFCAHCAATQSLNIFVWIPLFWILTDTFQAYIQCFRVVLLSLTKIMTKYRRQWTFITWWRRDAT